MKQNDFDYSKIPTKKVPELNRYLKIAEHNKDIAGMKALLIAGADAKANNSIRLFSALCNESPDIVRLLIPLSDPKYVQAYIKHIKALGIEI